MFMHYLEFLHLNTKCKNMESSLTKYPLEHKTKARDHKREVSHPKYENSPIAFVLM